MEEEEEADREDLSFYIIRLVKKFCPEPLAVTVWY